MSERHFVVVSRRWDNPAIEVVIDGAGILAAMPIEDYLRVLTMELGVQKALPDFLAAASRIEAGMKDETARVM